MRICFFLFLMLLMNVCAKEIFASEDEVGPTAAAIQQAPVDFNHPPRNYAIREISGWQVFVEQQLLDDDATATEKALARLESNLERAKQQFPPAALPDLQRVKLFVLFGPAAKAGGRTNGLEYFSREAAKSQDWLDPRMNSSIVIFNALNFNQLSDFWAFKALVHEFGHAQQLEHWPENRADIYNAWKHALQNGLYKSVREEDKDTFNPNYAAQNHLEYFAELSATYFAGNNYYPRDRATLKVYDPEGYALIEKLWGCPE